MNGKLGGKLIGFDLERNGRILKSVRFDKPIKNTVTKKCLDNLLTFNGSNDNPTSNHIEAAKSLFFNSNSSNAGRWGVFNYAALGSGVGATDVNDTALKSRVTDYSSDRKTGSGYCGTYSDTTNGILKQRISHSITINTDFDIREIGYFNRYWGTDNYDLSSRIVLDSAISVVSGDVFYPIYEIDIAIQQPEIVPDFFGLGAVRKVCAIHQCPWGSGVDGHFSIPVINSSGSVLYPVNQGSGKYTVVPAYSAGTLLGIYGIDSIIYYCNNQSQINLFNTPLSVFSINNDYWYYSNDNVSQRLVKNYTNGTFYRDVVYKLSPDWAAGKSDILALFVNGTLYCFGTLDANDNFTPSAITKPEGEEWTITTRQSWSTDLLSPTT